MCWATGFLCKSWHVPSQEAAWTWESNVFKALFQTRVLMDVYSSLSSCFAIFLAATAPCGASLPLKTQLTCLHLSPSWKEQDIKSCWLQILDYKSNKRSFQSCNTGHKGLSLKCLFFSQPNVIWTPPHFVLFPTLIVLLEKQHWILVFKNKLL